MAVVVLLGATDPSSDVSVDKRPTCIRGPQTEARGVPHASCGHSDVKLRPVRGDRSFTHDT